MKSIRDIYKIGKGPSSSHTMGPERAARMFKAEHAVAAMRAMNACNLSYFLTGSCNISYDMVCRAMHDTGIHLNHQFRETSEGGLARLYNRKK